MTKCPKSLLDAAFKAEVAGTFLDSSRLRKWVGPIAAAKGEMHKFHVAHDGPPKNLIAAPVERGLAPSWLTKSEKNVFANISTFRLPDIPREWSACQTAEAIGRSAGEWLDVRVVRALVRDLPYETTPIDISKTGISKDTFIKVRGSFLEDGHPQMDPLCAVLPANWYVTMLSKDMPIRDTIYRESLAGGIEVIFRPQDEMRAPADGRQRGFIFTQRTMRWAESGWLSDVANAPLGRCSEVDLRNHPEQPEGEVYMNILRGGAAVAVKSSGIIELIGRKTPAAKA